MQALRRVAALAPVARVTIRTATHLQAAPMAAEGAGSGAGAAAPGRSAATVAPLPPITAATDDGLPTGNAWNIRGGRVVCPATGVDQVLDVGIRDGKVAWLRDATAGGGAAAAADADAAVPEFDATGCLVLPGLIDMHTHVYHHATPLGIDVDHYCVRRGVTTAVDAGSAGATTFPGLRTFIADRAVTRVLAFLNISAHGLASAGCTSTSCGGELDSLNQVSAPLCAESIKANRDRLVGVKIRLSRDCADGGRNEAEAYTRALTAAADAGVPLMTHHTLSSVPLGGDAGCPGALRKGDVYTHMLHAYPSTIVDEETLTVSPAVHAAKERGVIFDVGHGQGSFSWTVAEICAKEGVWPDVISTDIHDGNREGPAYDLPTVMTKLLAVGMPLTEVIRAVTQTPARVIGWGDTIGALEAGRGADVAVVKLAEVDAMLEDCQVQQRRVTQRVQPVAVWRDGVRHAVSEPGAWPNTSKDAEQRPEWDKLVVKDETAPAARTTA